MWGWTDPQTKDEVAIIGLVEGTVFLQITDPLNPIILGILPQSGSLTEAIENSLIWADMKVFANHVFIVRETSTHGMQVMDLTKLREHYGKRKRGNDVRTLEEDAHYDQITSAHNIVINEQTAFAYVVGSKTCSGGLHVIDILNPLAPAYSGCFSSDGYTHDAQCVIYNGTDTKYEGREICFAFNEDTLTVIDVSDKANLMVLSRTSYDDNFYTHQGWLTEDHKHLMMNDELDESNDGGSMLNTRTLLWSVEDLENPIHVGSHIADVESIDHNLYVQGNRAYLANYCSGLRILDSTQVHEYPASM